MAQDKVYTFDGTTQKISWDGRLCIHVGECGRAKGDLFVAGRKPWADPDQSDAAGAAEVIARCPTGALALHDRDGNLIKEDAPSSNTMVVANDGPLYASGDLSIDGATEDMHSADRRAALCRCGKSKNKPFCDNSHREAGFQDAGAIGEKGLDTIEEGGPLAIKRIPNGPLEVSGNLTMVAGSGRSAWQGRKVYLCRCGASGNKPFCDGSHKRIDFVAD